MKIENLINRLENIIENPEEFLGQLKAIVKYSKLRKELSYINEDVNIKETKRSIEDLFDK